jgi:hypothetical protein
MIQCEVGLSSGVEPDKCMEARMIPNISWGAECLHSSTECLWVLGGVNLELYLPGIDLVYLAMSVRLLSPPPTLHGMHYLHTIRCPRDNVCSGAPPCVSPGRSAVILESASLLTKGPTK